MSPIWITIIVLILVYIFLEFTMKVAKWVLRIAIIALIIGALVFNYTYPSQLWDGDGDNKTDSKIALILDRIGDLNDTETEINETDNSGGGGQDTGEIPG